MVKLLDERREKKEMGKKTKVWACNECSATNAPCLCADPGTCYDVPRICPYYSDNTANWNVSDEYEIIKKAKEKLTTTQAVLKSEYPELSALLTPTPNCSICEWKESEERKDEGYSLEHYVCNAQGFSDCAADTELPGVYNTPECQALFKPVETGDSIKGQVIGFDGEKNLLFNPDKQDDRSVVMLKRYKLTPID